MNSHLQQLQQSSTLNFSSTWRAFREFAVDFGPSDYLRVYATFGSIPSPSVEVTTILLSLENCRQLYFSQYSEFELILPQRHCFEFQL